MFNEQCFSLSPSLLALYDCILPSPLHFLCCLFLLMKELRRKFHLPVKKRMFVKVNWEKEPWGERENRNFTFLFWEREWKLVSTSVSILPSFEASTPRLRSSITFKQLVFYIFIVHASSPNPRVIPIPIFFVQKIEFSEIVPFSSITCRQRMDL